jgi:predicted RND superfamily exporter protein
MQILHEFGLYLAAGVMASLLLQLAIVPAVLVWADSTPSAAYLRRRPAGRRAGRTERYARAMLRPGVAIGVLGVGLALSIGSILIARTAVYDYALSTMLSPDHPVTRGNKVLDTELSGVIPVEIAFDGLPWDFRDPKVLARMDRLAGWLEAHADIRVMGLSQTVKELASVSAPPGSTARSERAFPTDPLQVAQALDLIAGFRDGDYLRSLVRDDWSRARFQGFTPDAGGRAIIDLKDRYEAEARKVLAGTGVTSRMTGEIPVAYLGMNELSRELVQSTALALVMIILAVLLVFRNGWLAMIAVLPNVTPILVAMAGFRLSTDVLDPLPGVVLCIAIGLAADDTIHLVNRWRELRRLQPDRLPTEALVEAVVTVRRAMVSSSVVLVAGFLAQTLSSFRWNRQLGVLGSVVLLLALASDLLFGVAGLALYARRVERRRLRRTPRLTAGPPTEVTAPTPARV